MIIFLFPIISASLIIAVGFGGRQILPLTIEGITQTTPLDYLIRNAENFPTLVEKSAFFSKVIGCGAEL